jgi:hypothetical protein
MFVWDAYGTLVKIHADDEVQKNIVCDAVQILVETTN